MTQGLLLLPFLFLLAVDWIMRSVANQKRNGIQRTLWSHLDDLYIANLVRLSHNHRQIQSKISGLHHASLPEGLKLKTEETRILRINADTDEPVTHEGGELEEVESFTYLGGVVDKHADVTTRIDKTR